jgi:gamma-glutamyltranspeptidase/glutathione hydrolase/leukotriene-C4 hydrolase
MGLGGGFLMTIYIKSEQKSYSLTAREMAPLSATEKMYVNNSKLSTDGPMAIAVPGELLGYVEAKNRFGNPDISLLELMEPTIKLCENGFKVTRSLARAITYFDIKKDKFDDNLR